MKTIKKLIIATALASILAPALPTYAAAESNEEDTKEVAADTGLTPAQKIKLNKRLLATIQDDEENILKGAIELLNKGASANACNLCGVTALMLACRDTAIIDIVTELLNRDADVNQADMYGETALHIACSEGNIDAVKLLLDKNANINAAITTTSVYYTRVKKGRTPLMQVLYGAFFSGSGIRQNLLEIAKMLIHAGADVTLRDEDGKTATTLHLVIDDVHKAIGQAVATRDNVPIFLNLIKTELWRIMSQNPQLSVADAAAMVTHIPPLGEARNPLLHQRINDEWLHIQEELQIAKTLRESCFDTSDLLNLVDSYREKPEPTYLNRTVNKEWLRIQEEVHTAKAVRESCFDTPDLVGLVDGYLFNNRLTHAAELSETTAVDDLEAAATVTSAAATLDYRALPLPTPFPATGLMAQSLDADDVESKDNVHDGDTCAVCTYRNSAGQLHCTQCNTLLPDSETGFFD